MDSFACELLVHITAPSNVKDDKRYATIAQSVLDFQPITRTKVTSHESPLPSQSSNATDQIDDVRRQDPSFSIADASSTWIQAHDDALALIEQHRQPNPLTSNDRSLSKILVNSSFSEREHHRGPSNPPRPRTAPEKASSSFEIGLSFNRPNRRRAHSELSSITNSFSTVPNSFATPQNPDLQFELNESGVDAIRPCTEEYTTSRGQPKRKRQRVDENLGDHSGLLPLEAIQDNVPATVCGTKTPERPYPTKKTISTQNESGSISSTLSPSQPLRLGEVERVTTSPQIPTVDLTTPLRQRGGYQDMHAEDSNISSNMVMEGDRLVDQNSCQNDAEPEHIRRLQELEDEISAPDPPGGQRHFTTHITKTYERLSQRIPMSKVFRPVHVTRDVRVLERGYWLFSIRIGTDDIVAHSRRSLSQEERLVKLCHDLQAPTVEERLTKFTSNGEALEDETRRLNTPDAPLWTEKEFTTFWENMRQFIREGKAGWGSRLVKKHKANGLWEITFFCWGEVLSHTWLALWILSDKLIDRVPTTWVSGDGTAVVKMLGKKKDGQKTSERKGSWVKKEDGEFGCWGLSEE